MQSLVLTRVLQQFLLKLFFLSILSTEPFDVKQGEKIKADVVHKEREATSLLHCAYQCLQDGNCMSASFNDENGICQMSKQQTNIPPYDEMTVVDPSWTIIFYKSWHEVGDTCYFFSQTTINYGDAQNLCEKRGGKLAEPQTEAKFNLLRNFMNNNTDKMLNTSLWLGLNDIEKEGRFVWASSGKVLQYSVWDTIHGQPNDKGGQDCGSMSRGYDFRWHDNDCHLEKGAVCEIG